MKRKKLKIINKKQVTNATKKIIKEKYTDEENEQKENSLKKKNGKTRKRE